MSNDLSLFAEHPWEIPEGVGLLQTTRYGGVSHSPYDSFNLALHVGDEVRAVLENRRILSQYLPSDPLWLNQVHGDHVLDADQTIIDTPDADAAVTTQADRVLVIMTADCLPVYFVDRQARVIGLAHAGWRGLAKGVLTKTWALMCAKVPDLKASDIEIFLGPAIGPQAFEDVIGIDATDAVACSAKTGLGIADVLEDLIKKVPPPQGDASAPLQALIIDSWFDNYVGVVMLVRVVNGTLRPKDKILLMSTQSNHLVEHVGVFTPKSVDRSELTAGQVGFIIAGIKELKAAKVGDTVTHAAGQQGRIPAVEPLPGFKEVKPQVFAGLYPVESNQYDALRESLEKLKLNDASLMYEPEVSQALGFGFRCGFLGLLHMEIVQERLEREFKMDLITTAPTVVYEVLLKDGSKIIVDNPSKMPDPSRIEVIMEPIVTVNLFMPQEYVGSVITLCTGKRGMQTNMQYVGRQVQLTYEIPMAEIVLDFFDRLKSISRGYASMDYEFKEYRPSDVVKVDILINGDKVDALSIIVHRTNSQYRGREVVAKMREIIPRQMFDVAIQAAIGSNIIARENVKALLLD